MNSTVPIELRGGPFSVDYARKIGLTWKALQSKQWTRLSRGQYSWAGLSHDVVLKLRAVCERMTVRFAFSGATSGWLHRLDQPPCDPIEVTIGRDSSVRSRAGIKMRRAALPESEIMMVGGFPVTSPLRTVRDLGSRRDLTESVVAIDMALHARLVDLSTLSAFVEENPGTKGIRRLRRAIALADARAESPMETRLRLQLLTARLPRPCSQAELKDDSGRIVARVDLYYPDCRMVIEYDGENHKERIAADVKRQNALVNAGYHVLRFTAADLRVSGAAAAQVRKARNLLTKTGR